MRPEPEAPAGTLANMSAPPRSVVKLPRLAAPRAAATRLPRLATARAPGHSPQGLAGSGPDTASGTVVGRASTLAEGSSGEVTLGPGGGEVLSHALCVARIDLPTAVCAHLRMAWSAQSLTQRLGLARALVAIARTLGHASHARAPGRAARLEFDKVATLTETELLEELTTHLQAVRLPGWVPKVAFVVPPQGDGTPKPDRITAPRLEKPYRSVACPLQAARLAAAIRGPVFLRDVPLALTHLLDLWPARTLLGCWNLWLPFKPGQPPAVVRAHDDNPSTLPGTES